jgi:hypothetical protein
MTTITIQELVKTTTLSLVQIRNVFVDIQNSSIAVEVEVKDIDGLVVSSQTLTISGTDYTDIFNVDKLDANVLSQLKYQRRV